MASKSKVLDPRGPLIQQWNKIFVIICVMGLSVDPLFFYVPVINIQRKCFDLDRAWKITACVLRTFFDLFYIIRIMFQFRTSFIAPSSLELGVEVFVDDTEVIRKRYLRSLYFFIDILSVIPLPQMATLAIIPFHGVSYVGKVLLKYTVIAQFLPRLLRTSLLFKEVTSKSGFLSQTVWARAAYNFFLYLLASHLVGAFWYLLSVESEVQCWRQLLKNTTFAHYSILSCGLVDNPAVISLLNRPTSCPHKDHDDPTDPEVFNFGICLEALKYGIVQSTTKFRYKFFYSFWWGLRSISSAGQNLQTSTRVGEIIFSILISIFGVVLFSLLIGNVQKCLQSTTLTTTVRDEEIRLKKMDKEHWMFRRLLPESLKERIRRYEHYKWQMNRGVDEEALIQELPKDIRRDIKLHLCINLVKRVPLFESMDNELLEAMCERLKPVLHMENSYIIREGHPVDEMLFLTRGKVESFTTSGRINGFPKSYLLMAGDFCGEELLTWALDSDSSSNLPLSTTTVKTLLEVEAFALMVDDLKFIASQFRSRANSKQLQCTFRFYSQKWRTWAACFIQAAWRRYWKKKIERSLYEAEDSLHAFANDDGSLPSFGAIIQASRFESNVLRPLRTGGHNKMIRIHTLPPLPLQKPFEPDFTSKSF
ncbi:hypothetical protein RIF29_16474 [Crotalaria pallida]|uniref:Cyclic nucleotide-binding domain-containing protein n=1 Tax=Crotalaria pallida TaxID=3830 RepID=A0AAN9FGM6_CROPI